MKKKFDPVLDDLGHKVQTSNLKNSVRGKIVFVRNVQNMPYSVVCAKTVRKPGVLRIFDGKIDKMAAIDCGCLNLPDICMAN